MNDKTNIMHCPFCGSAEVSKPRFSEKAFAIGVLLVGFPFLFMSKIVHCFDCGKDFKKKKTK